MNNKSNRKVLFVTTLLVVILLIMYIAGFRLSPEAAAKAHAFLGEGFIIGSYRRNFTRESICLCAR